MNEQNFQTNWKYKNKHKKKLPKVKTSSKILYQKKQPVIYCTCCLEWNLRNIEENKKIWILSNKRWNTTNWIISLIKILEMLVSMVKFSLTILFKNPVPNETACFIIDLLFWMEFQKYCIKQENLNTFKHKMKQYFLNNLSNQNLGNVGGFDYALAVIKIIFLFIKQRFLHFSPLLLHSDWTTMKVRLFACFALHLSYCHFHLKQLWFAVQL